MNRSSFWLILSATLLFSIGLLMVFNTTSAELLDRSVSLDETRHALIKQMIYGAAGLLLGIAVFRWGYESLLKAGPSLLAFVSLLLLLVFFRPFGIALNGAHRWLSLFGYTFQPSECVKLLLPAAYIAWYRKGDHSLSSFLKMLALVSIPLALILLEPDNGTTLILLSLLTVLFFLSRIRALYWALPLSLLLGTGILIASQMPHVKSRLEVYLHPEADLKGKGHQPYQAKIATGSGQLLGRGLGESLQKLSYLPEARSDYIAAIFAEEMGFIGVLALISLYLILSCAGFSIALQAKEVGAFLFASTLSFLIAIQAFLNLGIVSALLPSKGMTLPFFSQGGSSLLIHIVALFLLLDISRKSERIDEQA